MKHERAKICPLGLEPLFSEWNKLRIFHGCIMWGIPDAAKVARGSHRYCEDAGAGIDQEMESLASKCPGCQRVQLQAPIAPRYPQE